MNTPRNVILLVADSLRYDAVYHNNDLRLPYIENNATQFSQARSSGCWTLPATSSLFTGMLPSQHGATTQSRAIHQHIPTLAEKMKAAGYHTYQITANVATTDVFGLHRGFDEVHKIWHLVEPEFNKIQQLVALIGKPRLRSKLFSKDAIMFRLTEDLKSATTWLQLTHREILRRARQIIAANNAQGKKSFVFVNMMETHFPYHVADTFELSANNIFNKAREIYSLYHFINQSFLKTGNLEIAPDMLRLIRARQRKSWEIIAPDVDLFARQMHENKDNLVVFCSDHGDNFGEQDWLYHFSNVTDGGNRVPIFWLSHEHQARKVIHQTINAKDIHRSILKACQISGEPSIVETPEESHSVMQSYWYNNKNKTLPKFKYNQLCFVGDQQRFLFRKGAWYSSSITTAGPELPFKALGTGINPIEEGGVSDQSKQAWLRERFREFEVFSEKIGS